MRICARRVSPRSQSRDRIVWLSRPITPGKRRPALSLITWRFCRLPPWTATGDRCWPNSRLAWPSLRSRSGARYNRLMTVQPPILPVTVADIDAAARVLTGVAVRTPLLSPSVLSERLGARVFVKPEVLQRTGSFKFRGAYNKLASIPENARRNGVVALSSGNHAQGVAHAAQLLKMHATIVMPSDAPAAKRERTRGYGAEVVLYDRDKEDREAIARAIAAKTNATVVPPYDDPLVIAGQGTAGREIAEDLAALGVTPDVVVVPASGGGLLAGVSTAVKAHFPQVL